MCRVDQQPTTLGTRGEARAILGAAAWTDESLSGHWSLGTCACASRYGVPSGSSQRCLWVGAWAWGGPVQVRPPQLETDDRQGEGRPSAFVRANSGRAGRSTAGAVTCLY